MVIRTRERRARDLDQRRERCLAAYLGKRQPLPVGYAQQVPEETWLLASAYEGLSRAYAVSGDRAAALEWKDKAVAQLELVDDADDRDIVARDVDSLPV